VRAVRAIPARAGRGALCGAALVSALGLWGCGSGSNSLTGSLDEVAPLEFEAVVVRASNNVLVLEYDGFPQGTTGDADGGSGGAGGTDVVFKMAVNIQGLKLDNGLDVDLTSRLDDGSPRVACTRAVGDDPRRELPPIQMGNLILDSDVNIGQNASGHFHILFGEGGQVGEGRTVNGTFSAPTQDADPGSQP
jgi:hypothetical protein